MKPATNAPIYAGMYKELAEIARAHGYALAVHGSLIRDFDLICVPWVDDPSSQQIVLKAFSEAFHTSFIGGPTLKKHGRVSYTINFSIGDCYIDISFMPTV